MGRAALLVAWLQACGAHPQSMVHPAGPASARVAELTWVLVAVLGGVFVLVMIALAVALVRRGAGPGTRFVLVCGAALPSVVLVGFLVYSLDVTLGLRPTREAALEVVVVGHQYWWEVRYPALDLVDANELHLPAGRDVRVTLRAADVIHSLWIPSLAGKMDLLPEHDNVLWLRASSPGEYRGQCAEYCGVQHAWMALPVVVHPPEAFDAWVSARQAPRPSPEDPAQLRGRAVFSEAGCAACHAVRGTEAAGALGPDLTFVGSRKVLGAGALPNTTGNLAGWIADPQAAKPGNLMPRSYLPPDDLHALVAWLGTLR